MGEIIDYLEIIRRAKLGDRVSMSRLAELARGKVFVYIFRLTLDHELSQDLTQDTMLEMVKSLKKLHQDAKFWPWLFRTALGKVQHHFRSQGNKRIEQKTIIDSEKILEHAHKEKYSELGKLIKKELSQAIVKAMSQIKLEYRNILSLRCFEQMPYSEIAFLIGCNELRAQLLFFRAKRSLKKQLSRNGYKKEHFLPALGLFGIITSSSTKSVSAATVNAAMIKVGLIPALVGSLATKTGVVAAVATTTLAVTIAAGPIQKFLSTPGSAFGYPESVIRDVDPDGDGWKGTLDDSGNGSVISIDANELVGNRPDNASTSLVIIPDGHSMELGFGGTIVDGPGIDIEYIARRTGNYPRIFLTDGMNQSFLLETITNIRRAGLYEVVGYDISGNDLPFEPSALLLEGNGGEGPWKGAALFNIRARIVQ
jgi:RNA polymerase sigma factor (sigma-70 family)